MNKSIFKSRIFWVAVLTALFEISQVVSLPPGTVTAIGAVVTILLRLDTKLGAYLFPKDPLDPNEPLD